MGNLDAPALHPQALKVLGIGVFTAEETSTSEPRITSALTALLPNTFQLSEAAIRHDIRDSEMD
jgi:hypothetical protein